MYDYEEDQLRYTILATFSISNYRRSLPTSLLSRSFGGYISILSRSFTTTLVFSHNLPHTRSSPQSLRSTSFKPFSSYRIPAPSLNSEDRSRWPRPQLLCRTSSGQSLLHRWLLGLTLSPWRTSLEAGVRVGDFWMTFWPGAPRLCRLVLVAC